MLVTRLVRGGEGLCMRKGTVHQEQHQDQVEESIVFDLYCYLRCVNCFPTTYHLEVWRN